MVLRNRGCEQNHKMIITSLRVHVVTDQRGVEEFTEELDHDCVRQTRMHMFFHEIPRKWGKKDRE